LRFPNQDFHRRQGCCIKTAATILAVFLFCVLLVHTFCTVNKVLVCEQRDGDVLCTLPLDLWTWLRIRKMVWCSCGSHFGQVSLAQGYL